MNSAATSPGADAVRRMHPPRVRRPASRPAIVFGIVFGIDAIGLAEAAHRPIFGARLPRHKPRGAPVPTRHTIRARAKSP